jgi:hypothetical protein
MGTEPPEELVGGTSRDDRYESETKRGPVEEVTGSFYGPRVPRLVDDLRQRSVEIQE